MPEELIGLMAYCTQNMAADSMVSVGPLWELKFCLGILPNPMWRDDWRRGRRKIRQTISARLMFLTV